MNVTKENFKEAAEEIEALLPTAAFVAFDEEMTGISVEGQIERLDDIPAKRYAQMRSVASRYNIIQFGLALFHKKESISEMPSSDAYEARVYNFYLFPEIGQINMEASAIAFNRDHGMDWNKWIRQGVPYVNQEAAQKIKDALLPSQAKPAEEKRDNSRKSMTLTKDSDIKVTADAVAALTAWLADESKKDETEFEVITTNGYLRRFMHETFASDFPTLIVESRPTEKRGISTMVVLRLNETQKSEREAKLRSEKELEVTRKIGFARVFRALVEARKPLVGHAMMMDLLFALDHFEGPLPESYAKFKEVVHGLFPLLFDTQLLAKSEPFKYKPQPPDATPGDKPVHRFGSMALGAIFKVFTEEAAQAEAEQKPTVKVFFAAGHDRYGPNSDAFHEAGYDAYVTGTVFAHMARDALNTEFVPRLSGRTTMWKSLFHLNLSGDDELISKGVYVHTQGLKGRDDKYLKDVFAQIKVQDPENAEVSKPAVPEIRWIDADSAFAVLPEACRDGVCKLVESCQTADADAGALKLTSWEDWLAAQTSKNCASSAAADEPLLKKARTSAL